MQIPLRVTFHGVPPSAAMEARIRTEVDALARFHPRVTGCHVTVEAPPGRQHKGGTWAVRITLAVPGEDIAVTRDPGLDHGHEDPYVALRDAFSAARRMLEDRARRVRGDVKSHEAPMRGRVISVHGPEHYGFLETDDGLQVYFHEHAVLGGRFRELGIGSDVRFAIAEGEGLEGPQASTVVPIGAHHPVA